MFKKHTLISATNRATSCSNIKEEETTEDLSEVHLSALEVVSNDGLLMEILLRLPVISLMLFKSVSKRWLSLIADSNFTLRRSKSPTLDSPSGIFLWRHHEMFFGYDFVPFDTRIPAYRYPHINTFTFGSDEGNIYFLQSCNGLLLLGILYIMPDELYVYNPSMNLLKKLPDFYELLVDTTFDTVGHIMVFDPTKSPHYKVVNAGVIRVNGVKSLKIMTYSSDTCKWNVWGGQFSINSFSDGFQHGIYLNDSIHWLKKVDESCLLFMLDIEHQALTSIQTPETSEGGVLCDHKLFESRGCLLLACITCTNFLHSQHLNIYEISKGYSRWLVKYSVNLDDIIRMCPQTTRLPSETKRFCSSILCIVLGSREEDSFMVFERNGMVLQYKIALKTLHLLHDLGSKVMTDHMSNFPFTASFARV